MKKLLLLSFFLMLGSLAAFAQRSLTGNVTDEKGEPLIGANVVVKGTTTGTLTDVDGNFRLTVSEDAKVLIFTFTGFTTQEVEIGASNVYSVSMAEGVLLEGAIVVGYAEQEKRFTTQAVSTISSDKFKDWPVMSPQQLLQGQAAGVQMVNSSGLLGANSVIRIRGAASLSAGGNPLIVVDGVPLNDQNMSQTQGAPAGAGLNPLMNINPNDIESMTVLKDAAAVSIYGSRGANGVILITTKKGKKGEKTSINLDMFTGFSNPTNLEQMMNTEQFTDFVNDFQRAQGTEVTDYSSVRGDYFDWPTNVVRTGRQNSANLSIRGGSEKTSFFVAGNFMRESGFTIGNEADSYNGRFNFEHEANRFVTVGANINVSSIDMNRIGVENNTAAPLTSSYLQLPFVLPRDDNGAFVNTGFIQNVLAREELNINGYNTRRFVGNVYATFNLAPGLTFKTDWGADQFGTSEKSRTVNLFTPGGSAYRDLRTDNKWMSTNTLNYTFEKGDHAFNALGGYAYETSRFEQVFIAGAGFASDGLPNISSAATPTSTDEIGSEWALESQFVRLNYRLKNKYLFELNGRRDGSSRFGADNRYGLFGAASLGWILSEEAFMKNQNFFNFMKFTASVGTAGNDRIGNFTSLALYGGGADADYLGLAGLRPTQVPFPALRWEESRQVDLGLSMIFLDNRMSLDVNVYDKFTYNMLLSNPLPFTTGFASRQENVGEMSNRGIDIDFNVNVINKSDMSWSIGFNAGFLRNELLNLPESAALDPFDNPFIPGSAAQRAVAGRTINEFFMVRANGVNSQTGDFEWLDVDGNATTTYSANDRVYVGSAIPKFVGGINTNFNYKNIDVNALFNFTYGNMVLIDGLRFTENILSPGFNKSTALLDQWTEVGDEAFVPNLASPTARFFNQPSTLQLQDGSFIRLRNLSIGYTVPQRALGNQDVIRSARIYAMGQNLFLIKAKDFRGPDPEVSANGTNNLVQGESFFALPQARVFTVGVNFGF